MITQIENLKCPLCKNHSKSFDIWVATDVGNIFKCNICGLGFLDPKSIKEFNKINIELYNAREYYNLIFKMQHELNQRYKKQLKEIYKILKKKGTLLDFVCSIGMFLNQAKIFYL